MDNMKQTVLFEEHQKLKAKFLPFAGYNMPIEYVGILKEHEAVRTNMGLFDVSHMGEIEIKGKGALDFCQKISTNDVSALKPGKIQYSAILNEEGGILDDCTVYCLAQDHYLFVVNAGCKDKIYAWLKKQHEGHKDSVVEDKSDLYGLLALQGPAAEAFLASVIKRNLETVRYYEFIWAEILGAAVLISRTGYTGEDGFELYVPHQKTVELWKLLMEQGAPKGLMPIGLGARDTLRLEMGYLLYGSDMNEKVTPLECGLSWIVKMNKGLFVGKRALEAQKQKGVSKKLYALEMKEKGIPRPHYEVYQGANRLGEMTSGTFSPTKKAGIGLAMLNAGLKPGDEVIIKVRSKDISAVVTKTPFVQGSVKK